MSFRGSLALCSLLIVGTFCVCAAHGAPASDPFPGEARDSRRHRRAGETAAAAASQDWACQLGPRRRPTLGTRKQGEDWPVFLGPTGDSKSSERGIITKWPRQGLPIVWQQRTGVGYGMPAISRGRLFQFARFGDKARLTCQNSETGEPLWQFEYDTDYEDLYGYDNGPRCSPIVDDDRVYTFGAEGMLHCLRVSTASRSGSSTPRPGLPWRRISSASAARRSIEGDLLICQVGGSSDDTRNVPPGQLDRVRGKDSGVVAFDKRTGEVKYHVSDELASYATPTLATIDGRRWLFVFARGGLLGMNPADGKIDFHFPWRATILESVNASNPRGGQRPGVDFRDVRAGQRRAAREARGAMKSCGATRIVAGTKA